MEPGNAKVEAEMEPDFAQEQAPENSEVVEQEQAPENSEVVEEKLGTRLAEAEKLAID